MPGGAGEPGRLAHSHQGRCQTDEHIIVFGLMARRACTRFYILVDFDSEEILMCLDVLDFFLQ